MRHPNERCLEDGFLLVHHVCTGGDCPVFHAQLFVRTTMEQFLLLRAEFRTANPELALDRHFEDYRRGSDWPRFLTWLRQEKQVAIEYGPRAWNLAGVSGGNPEEAKPVLGRLYANAEEAKRRGVYVQIGEAV